MNIIHHCRLENDAARKAAGIPTVTLLISLLWKGAHLHRKQTGTGTFLVLSNAVEVALDDIQMRLCTRQSELCAAGLNGQTDCCTECGGENCRQSS